MSKNWSGGKRTYRKTDDYYWYDKLPMAVKKALMESVNDWDSKWCHAMVNKHGVWIVLKAIKEGDKKYCEKGTKPISSYVAAEVKPLYANW